MSGTPVPAEAPTPPPAPVRQQSDFLDLDAFDFTKSSVVPPPPLSDQATIDVWKKKFEWDRNRTESLLKTHRIIQELHQQILDRFTITDTPGVQQLYWRFVIPLEVMLNELSTAGVEIRPSMLVEIQASINAALQAADAARRVHMMRQSQESKKKAL